MDRTQTLSQLDMASNGARAAYRLYLNGDMVSARIETRAAIKRLKEVEKHLEDK